VTGESHDDPYLGERIRTALAQDQRVNELGVQVRLVGLRVFVTGTVATTERQQAVASVIAEHFPDLEIHNDVTVQEVGAHPSRETLS
jgi:osmotically-inducible protein OsmY